MTNRNKQIVLSADRAPKDIDMDDRMRSRFISGLLADIKPPDYETRLAILKNYLSRVNQHTSFYGNIPDEVLFYLADVATSNIREMEGSITRLVSNMTLLRKDSISVEEAQEPAGLLPHHQGQANRHRTHPERGRALLQHNARRHDLLETLEGNHEPSSHRHLPLPIHDRGIPRGHRKEIRRT